MGALVAPIISNILGGISGFLGGKANKTTTDFKQNQYTDMYNEPVYDPKTRALRDLLINHYLDQLQGSDDLWSGYANNAARNINQGMNANEAGIQSFLASRGIKGPAAGWASTAPRLAAQNQLADTINQIPLMRDQRNQQILGQTGQFLSSLPITSRQHGTQETQGQQVQTGTANPYGNAFGNLANLIAGFYGQGAFNTKPKTTNPSVSTGSDWGWG